MEKELFYYYNDRTGLTAIGEIDLPYVYTNGYRRITKEEYERYNEERITQMGEENKEMLDE